MTFLRLFWSFFRIGAMNELQYRVNFFVQLFQSALALIIGLVGLALVFNYTTELAGWTRPELLAVMGVFILMGGVIRTFIQPNMERLMADVQEGTLDYALTKPTDSQIIISVREVRIWQSVDVLVGAGVLVVALVEVGASLNIGQALMFTATLLMGAVIIYCFWLMLTTGAFWLVRMDQIVELFQGVYQAGRWPVGIYPQWLRLLLTFLVPVAFAVTVPSSALVGRLNAQTLLLTAVLTVALQLVSRWFWKIGLRNYAGASA
jgi:viologen exporter family transport system permease protein